MFNCKLKLQWYIFIVIYKWKRMLLQNVDTASVLLYALFIMSYDATHATHRLYFRFCDCG